MSVPMIQPSFAAGELAPAMFGRIDVDRYHVGLSTCRNMTVGLRGGAYSRAGTAFCGFSKQTGRSVPPRLITFQFSINQGLALEFGNLYMRVLSGGSFVTEAPTNITGITQANPGVVTDVAHGYANGDWIFFASIGGMTQLNNQILIVAGRTANTYTLTDVYGNAINTTGFGAYTGGGTASRVFTLTTPYADVDLPWLKFTQSADTMSLCCWNQQTGTLYAPQELVRTSAASWTISAFATNAIISPPAGVTASPFSSQTPTTFYSYIVTALDKKTGQESLPSTAATVQNNDIALNAGSNIIGWNAVAGASSYNIYKCPPSYQNFPPAGTPFGYIGTAVGQTLVDANLPPDFTKTPPLHANPFDIGTITDVVPTAGGNGNYSAQTIGYALGTATGTGFLGTPVVVNGNFAGLLIENPGKNFLPGDTITITDTGGGLATGSYNFNAGTPGGGSTIILNGVPWHFVSVATGPQFASTVVQGDVPTTVAQLANDLNNSTLAGISGAKYSANGNLLQITFKTPGAGGNAYTIAAGSYGGTPSGATLTGGGTAGAGATATLTIGPQTGTYPSTVAYFQQRRVYASSPNQPNTYFMSQPGAFSNFDFRIPTVATDSITGTPWSLQVNGIQHMLPMPGGLVVLTGLQAWQLTGTGGSSFAPQPITPTSQTAQPQAFNGCSPRVPPIRIDYDVNYIQAKGSLLRDLSYNFWANIYTGTDLTYLSPHLFVGHQVLEMAWCEEPFRLIWATRDDGILLSLTYFKQQEVMGWARHDTQGQYWSVASVTEPPVDALYLASQRALPNGNAYLIERMDDRLWPANENTWCVDAGLTTTLAQPNATLSASSSTGAGIPNGFTGLIGGQGYSAGTTCTLVDPTGTGCVVTPTIIGGVITNLAFAGGTNYTAPKLVFNDPAGTGTGASATITLDNHATFTATANVFSAGSVGQVIRMGGGRATVTVYTDPQHVTANITIPITQTIPNTGGLPLSQPAGSWSIAPNLNTVSGLWHLIGATVTGIADGKPIIPQVVTAQGTINIATTPGSLVTIGLGFMPQLQTLYLESGQPTLQGRQKKIAAATARLEASAISGIVGGSNQPDGSVQSPPTVDQPWGRIPASAMTPLEAMPGQNQVIFGTMDVPLYTGDVRINLTGGFQRPGQAALQQNAPLPMNVLAIIPELLPGSLPEASAGNDNGQAKRGPLWGTDMKKAA